MFDPPWSREKGMGAGIAMATRAGNGAFPWQEQLGGALGEVVNEPWEGEGGRDRAPAPFLAFQTIPFPPG